MDEEKETVDILPRARSTVQLGCLSLSTIWANILFGFLAVAGQVGKNVALPLWVDSTTSQPKTSPQIDSYFFLSFASLSLVIIFGLATLFIKVFQPHRIGETERNFPTMLLAQVGICDGLNGVLMVFASNGTRTAPYLQAILGNFIIPLTIAVRYMILKKKPTLRKIICGLFAVVGLFVCLLATIFPKIDPHSTGDLGGATGTGKFLWPLCFMLAIVPAAVMNVIEEKSLKLQHVMSKQGINLVYFLFWTSFYQLLTVGLCFWADIIPGFGNAKNISEFAKSWWFSIQCFFGDAGCNPTSGIRGAIFIVMYVLSYVGGANLLRYAEGATFLAIINSLVTPLGFLFWTLFKESPFQWHPAAHTSTWLSIGALAIMVQAIYFYNTGPPEISLVVAPRHGEDYCHSANSGSNGETMMEKPILDTEVIRVL